MIIISYTFACESEEVAQRIQLVMPQAEAVLREPGVTNVSIMWSNEEDEDIDSA